MDLRKVVRSRQIEALADEVVSAFSTNHPPVDVGAIAKSEGIILAPGEYGEGFFGRLEYHPPQQAFLLFHPTLDPDRPDFWQVRFSIAHELGHYYVPEHRRLLLRGASHTSSPGFVCENVLEREADEFAAALLIPPAVLSDSRFRRQPLSLKNILAVAKMCQTSAIAAALRCVRATEEAAWIVLSVDGIIQFAIPSEECQAHRIGWIKKGPIPVKTPSWQSARTTEMGAQHQSEVPIRVWLPNCWKDITLWEESMRLGKTNLVLTLLAFETEDDS